VSENESVNQHEGTASNAGYRLITHRMPFSAINTALDSIRAGEVGRCILEMAS
jgi:Zn-dependent alcohol dehydrogenase